MLINPRSFSVAGAPLALPDLGVRSEAAANVLAAILQEDEGGKLATHQKPYALSPDLVHWDEWAAKVRLDYTMPLKRYTRRLGLLLATMERSQPIASTLLATSAIGIAFIIHLVLEQFTN